MEGKAAREKRREKRGVGLKKRERKWTGGGIAVTLRGEKNKKKK